MLGHREKGLNLFLHGQKLYEDKKTLEGVVFNTQIGLDWISVNVAVQPAGGAAVLGMY